MSFNTLSSWLLSYFTFYHFCEFLGKKIEKSKIVKVVISYKKRELRRRRIISETNERKVEKMREKKKLY